MKPLVAYTLLLLAAMAWGSGFAVTKGTLEQMPPYFIMALRFSIATLIMFPFICRRLRAAPRRIWILGMVIGVFVFLGHLLQFSGMQYITAGRSAFLTAVYVVLVPFIVWGLRGARPSGRHIAACCLCLLGVGMISLDGSLTVGIGEWLTLVGGICFAIQIACISRYAEGCDMMAITWISIAVTAVCSLLTALLLDWKAESFSVQGIFSTVYLAVVCSALAFSAQYTGLKYAPPAVATILLSMESVFGCLTGVLFLHETVGGRMLAGCVIILASLLLGSMPNTIQLKNIFIRR